MTQPTNVASLLEWPGENLTLSLLGSSLRTLTVLMNQPPFKASRRVRTTLIQHGTLEVRGVPTVLTHYTAWDSPHFKRTMQCQGGDASRVRMSTPPCTQLTHVVALPVCSSFRVARPIVPEERGKSQKSDAEKKQPKEPRCHRNSRGMGRSHISDKSTDNKSNGQEHEIDFYESFCTRKSARAWVQFLLKGGARVLTFLWRFHRLLVHVHLLSFYISALAGNIRFYYFLLRRCFLRSYAFSFVLPSHTTKSLTGGVLSTFGIEGLEQ